MLRSLSLELHVLPGVETGLWCDACALPSGWRVRWVLADVETLKVEMRGSYSACEDCKTPLAVQP